MTRTFYYIVTSFKLAGILNIKPYTTLNYDEFLNVHEQEVVQWHLSIVAIILIILWMDFPLISPIVCYEVSILILM